MIEVKFSEQEVNTFLQLLDVAVKSGGLNTAGAAFILQQKMLAAYNAANDPRPEAGPPQDKAN